MNNGAACFEKANPKVSKKITHKIIWMLNFLGL